MGKADELDNLFGREEAEQRRRERAAMVFTDPPYGVSYEGGGFEIIKGDEKRRDDLYKMLLQSFREMARVATDRSAFYIWHASSTREDFAQAMKAAGLIERQYLMWVKPAIAFGRADYQQHEPCQPAGTMVERVVAKASSRGSPSITESIPIEKLKTGDRVVTFSPGAQKILKRGREITQIGKRRYIGNMHTIKISNKTTRATADHRFTIKIDEAAADKHVVYLMQRGDWWRVGTVRVYNSRGFAVGVRLTDERADAAWIVAVCDDVLSARATEQATSCLYGIPTTHWETSKRPNIETIRSKTHIGQIYAQVGIGFIEAGARRLLESRGLDIDDPLIRNQDREPTSRKKTRLVRARNLVPAIMQIPVPTEAEKFEWQTITAATFQHFEGDVYSMDVKEHGHYVADGIVTHNCFYAAKGAASPAFYGERAESTVWHAKLAAQKDTAVTIGNGVLLLDGHGGSLFVQTKAPKSKKLRQFRITDGRVFLAGAEHQTTVWEVGRDSNYEHPTQKPVELARRAIENSSQPGEIVTDGFMGSGTTLIGAEITGRRCYGIELDPVYAAVIIRRWEKFSGQQAMLDGKTIEQIEREGATRHSGKPVRRRHAGTNGKARALRKGGDAGQPAPRRKPTGEPPVVAGDS